MALGLLVNLPVLWQEKRTESPATAGRWPWTVWRCVHLDVWRALLRSMSPQQIYQGRPSASSCPVYITGWCIDLPLKEQDLILSNIPSFLIPGLPFVFSAAENRPVSAYMMEKGKFPSTTSLSKLFWLADVQGLHQEFLSAKQLGVFAVEEWQKGLEWRGQQHQADAARWEQFSESGAIRGIRTMLYPGHRAELAAAEATKAKLATALVGQESIPAAGKLVVCIDHGEIPVLLTPKQQDRWQNMSSQYLVASDPSMTLLR